MAKLTISLEADPSDILPLLLALLTQQRDESGRRPRPASPFPRGFRVSSPFNLEDLLETLAREGSDESERMRAYRDARGQTTGATGAGDDTPPDPEGGSEPQGFDLGDKAPY